MVASRPDRGVCEWRLVPGDGRVLPFVLATRPLVCLRASVLAATMSTEHRRRASPPFPSLGSLPLDPSSDSFQACRPIGVKGRPVNSEWADMRHVSRRVYGRR